MMMRRGSTGRIRHNSVNTTTDNSESCTTSTSNTSSSDTNMCTSNSTPSSASLRPVTPTATTAIARNDSSDDLGERTPTSTVAIGAPRPTYTRSNTSESNGRREKRRFFRRNRGDEGRRGSHDSCMAGSSGGGSAFQLSESDDDSGDTVHSLPDEPPHMISSDMISSPPPTAAATSSSSRTPHSHSPPRRRLPSPSLPGAVAARGRAFGELPQWARIVRPSRPAPSASRGDSATPTASTPTSTDATTTDNNNNNSTPTASVHVRVPRRSISETSRGAFASLYQRPSSRISRSTSHGTTNSHAMLNRSAGSSFFGNVGNLFSSFRLSGQTLPEAEILDSEKVVYAEVIEPQDHLYYGWMVCSPTLMLYSIFLLLVGILIGRWTVFYSDHFNNPSWNQDL